jgi:hypothetical protein
MGGGLQRHTHGEEPLDDVVVQIPGDSLAVAHHRELFAVVLGAIALDGESCLLPEALHDPDLLGAETGPTDQPHHAEYAVVSMRRRDGDEEQGAEPGRDGVRLVVLEHRRRIGRDHRATGGEDPTRR